MQKLIKNLKKIKKKIVFKELIISIISKKFIYCYRLPLDIFIYFIIIVVKK